MKAKQPGEKPPAPTERRDGYVGPKVQTYTSAEILDSLGPAQGLTSGASPDDHVVGGRGHGHGHGHGRH